MRSFVGEMLDVYDNLYNELWRLSRELEPWFDIDKVKPDAVYVWTKGLEGENVFDIHSDCLQFFYCGNYWEMPTEAMNVVKKIQDKLIEIEKFRSSFNEENDLEEFL